MSSKASKKDVKVTTKPAKGKGAKRTKETTAGKKGKGKTDPKTNNKAIKKGPKTSPNKGKNTKAAAATNGKKGNAKNKKDTKKTAGAAATGSKKGQQSKQTKKQTKKSGQTEPAAEETAAAACDDAGNNEPEIKVDIGEPVIIPETKDFETDVPAMKEFELKEDSDVDLIREQFELIENLLKQRKKDCLAHAKQMVLENKVNDETPPICIDIDGMNKLLQNIGNMSGAAEQEYNVMKQRIKSIDKAKELMAYEAKHASVSKELEATGRAVIEKQMGEIKQMLDEAEPILQAARDLLTTITKSSLDEIRALPKPHPLLVKTVKACAIMVGKPESELDGWNNVKKLLKTAFINDLLKFEARNITKAIRKTLENDYLAIDNDEIPANEKLTYENVLKANAVAGSFVKWIEAQLKYNEFIPKVEPAQKKLKELQIKLQSEEGIIDKFETALSELNKRIETAKQEMRDEGKQLDKYVNVCKLASAGEDAVKQKKE